MAWQGRITLKFRRSWTSCTILRTGLRGCDSCGPLGGGDLGVPLLWKIGRAEFKRRLKMVYKSNCVNNEETSRDLRTFYVNDRTRRLKIVVVNPYLKIKNVTRGSFAIGLYSETWPPCASLEASVGGALRQRQVGDKILESKLIQLCPSVRFELNGGSATSLNGPGNPIHCVRSPMKMKNIANEAMSQSDRKSSLDCSLDSTSWTWSSNCWARSGSAIAPSDWMNTDRPTERQTEEERGLVDRDLVHRLGTLFGGGMGPSWMTSGVK